MATMPRYPSLFQINTRVWLQRLSHQAGKPITLADIDDATLDGFAQQGFDWIWLLSVWQTGAAGRSISRSDPQWRAEFQTILPDLTAEDICGTTIRTLYFPLTICRKGIARILVNSRVGLKRGLTRIIKGCRKS